MRSFTCDALPGRVVFGAGASREKLVEEVDRLGSSRVALIAAEGERTLVNPRPVDEAGIRGILEDAYAGRRPEPVAERSM
jgi:hypothetical protein